MEENCNIPEEADTNVELRMFSFRKIFLKNYKEKPKCVVCHKEFKDKQYYDKHIEKFPLDQIQSCERCDVQFHTHEAVLLHVMKDHDKNFTCYSCSLTLDSELSLKEHVQMHETDTAFKHQCELCGRRFAAADTKLTHVRLHLGILSQVCEICGKTLRSKDRLLTHLRLHTGEKPESCRECGKKFTTVTCLKMHMRIHTGEKPYTCPDCGKKFTQKSAVDHHIMRIHKGLKPYSCSLCPKRFATRGALRVHVGGHTGEAAYCCPHCQRRFTNKRSLVTHQRTHTGEKPFPCHLCNETFISRLYLKRHMFCHTDDEKSYSCDQCGKTYGKLPSLRKHEKTQHLNKNT